MQEPNPTLELRLLSAFRRTFEARAYLHRASNQGDLVAIHLYEDLVTVNSSTKLMAAIRRMDRVVNTRNVRTGVKARRGDGTFGAIVPGIRAVTIPGFAVARGPVATVEIGVEVKVLAKAMIKQIDRVISDLRNQVSQFGGRGGNPISVGIVGINEARHYVGHEGSRSFPTTGKGGFLHPHQEADEAKRRLLANAAPSFDEFLILRFRATNEPPYPFEWVDEENLRMDYAAALTRISSRYEQRF